MVLVTALAGAWLASAGSPPWLSLAWALLGTGLLSAGASALNQVIERTTDAKMRRTANRPVPAGRLGAEEALAFGALLIVAGLGVLILKVNLLTALLGAVTVVGYLLIYTPMKRVTSLATIVGAVPGAIPPMMGWSAMTDELAPGAWALFGILFFWQLPHFLAIAWMYRADYARGGFPLLTVRDPDGQRTARQMILWATALVPVSLVPAALGLAGGAYFAGAFLLGLGYLAACVLFARDSSHLAARRLLLASVFYLPAILGILLVDRVL